MDFNQVANVAELLQAIFVAATALFIWRELRENTRLTRAANIQRLVETSSPFYLQIVQDRHVAELWVKGADDFSRLDDLDKYRFRALINWWLNFHENIYFQWYGKLLEDRYYQAWSHALDTLIRKPGFSVVWGDVRDTYDSDFAGHIDRKIQRQ